MYQQVKRNRKGLRKLIHKICHFRSGKFYKASRRNWARLRGRPVVHFLHVRKAGGSAIKTALVPHALTGPFLVECHPHRITINDIPEGEKVFFVVRDPVKRFVSGFNSRLNQGAPAHIVPWSKEEEEVFKKFQTPNELAMTLGNEDAEQCETAYKAMKAISHVRSSYWDWFIDEQTLHRRADDLLYVLRQKNLNDDFTKLVELLKLHDTVKLSENPVTSNRTPQSMKQQLEPDAEAAIREYYSRDYEFLALCRELFGLKGAI